MKSRSVLCVVVCFVAASASHLQAQERSRAGVYALEGLGALAGVAGCGGLAAGFAFVGLMADWGMDNPGQNPGAAAVAYSLALVSAAALPATAGYTADRVGAALGEDGSRGWAIGGAYAGLPVAVGAIALGVYVGRTVYYHDPYGRKSHSSSWDIPLYVLGGLAIPVGAVVGYNLGTPSHTVGGRLQPPGVALTYCELPDHSVSYGLKVQLAGLRF